MTETESELEDFLILRNLDEPLPRHEFGPAAERAVEVVEQLADEGVGIRWLRSDVRTRADGSVTGTFCHYRAENEETLYEHADRAGFPVTRIDLHGETLENGAR